MTARALLAAVLLLAPVTAHGRDGTACSATQGGRGAYWNWREVDGRRCYYAGRPGKPKNELYWPAHGSLQSGPAQAGQPEVSQSPPPAVPDPPVRASERQSPELEPVAVPHVVEPIVPVPVQPLRVWRPSDADQLLAVTCCWPEEEPPKVVAQALPAPQTKKDQTHEWELVLILAAVAMAAAWFLHKRGATRWLLLLTTNARTPSATSWRGSTRTSVNTSRQTSNTAPRQTSGILPPPPPMPSWLVRETARPRRS